MKISPASGELKSGHTGLNGLGAELPGGGGHGQGGQLGSAGQELVYKLVEDEQIYEWSAALAAWFNRALAHFRPAHMGRQLQGVVLAQHCIDAEKSRSVGELPAQ